MNTSPITRTEPLAIVSLVMSTLSVVLGPLGFIPGIICGHIARSRIRQTPGYGGDSLATAGLIVGYIFVAAFLIVLVFFLIYMAKVRADFPNFVSGSPQGAQ